jgi:cytochrome c oxidase subunit II
MKRFAIFLIAASAGYLHQQSVVRSATEVPQTDEQIIHISASSFEFKPSEITVRKGVPVLLELTGKEGHHGFKLAEFHIRVDVKPGVTENIRFVPTKTGKFTFFCDVFCGEGHEDMSGTITVIES